MKSDSKPATVRSLGRINLRLAGDAFAAIDASCAAHPGNVSRSTWIAEAIGEKLARDGKHALPQMEHRAHG